MEPFDKPSSTPIEPLGDSNTPAAYAKGVKALCFCVLSVILLAGLWPFHAPRNQVAWLENGNGLDFGRYGSILSLGAFHENSSTDKASGSIEIWLKPGLLRSARTILSFDGSDHPGAPFSIRQQNDSLVILRHNRDSQGTVRTAWLPFRGIFLDKRAVFVTITLAKQNTLVYVDGVLADAVPIAGTSTNNLTGRLVVANSPTASDSWSGQMLGLAIYQRTLTPAQIAKHYETWTRSAHPVIAEDEAPVALYLFDERTGNVVRNQLDLTTSLTIPAHYFVLRQGFLSFASPHYKTTWSYRKDIMLNIAGFIPFGLVFAAYFSAIRNTKWPATTAIFLGFATSLTIEILQAFLPTRGSGVSDLVTNTSGTSLGVMLYRWKLTQDVLTKVRQYCLNQNRSKRANSELVVVSADST
jgi:VanZ family protein